jgi:hypothetical protein
MIKLREVVLLSMFVALSGPMFAQTPEDFSRKNTWTTFAEYSNTSSHILMGASRQRKLVDLGFGYTRRVFRFPGSELDYHVELRPVLFESDPFTIFHLTYTIQQPGGPVTILGTSVEGQAFATVCQPSSSSQAFTEPGGAIYTESAISTCGRQWTAGQAFSPIGFKYSMRTHHALQPYILGTLGYMYTSRPVPIADAESFNFLFNFWPGIELYRKGMRSISLEYLFSHFSNRDTAIENPGTDNMMFKLSYSFGR